jgi:hypothetical protein
MEPRRRFAVEWTGIFLLCFALCAYFQFLSPYMPEEDGYFHIKTALLMRRHGLFLDGFPWSFLSLWRDRYSDGCLLYHLYLIPFTFGDLVSGMKWATVLLSAFQFSSFFAVLTLNRVRARFYWFGVFLLGGGFFWWRMLAPRPQVLSAALLLWSVHFLLNERRRSFFIISFVYGLSYVAAFLPQIFSVIRWAYQKTAERRASGTIVVAGLAGYGLSAMLHPYFPKNLEFFYVQNVYVMFLALTQKVNLSLAGEFLPLDTRQFVFGHLPLIAHVTVLSFIFMHRRPALSKRTLELFPIAAAVLLLTCASKRFLEYSVPVATLFCAFFAGDVLAGVGLRDFLRDYGPKARFLLAAWLLAFAAAAGVEASYVRGDFSRLPPPRFEELSRVLVSQAPPGEMIFTCDWDEPPELYFFDDRNVYPVMMDPTFMYYWNPTNWRQWNDLANARLSLDETYRGLTQTFHARYGLCGSKFTELRRILGADARFQVLEENDSGFVFKVL